MSILGADADRKKSTSPLPSNERTKTYRPSEP